MYIVQQIIIQTTFCGNLSIPRAHSKQAQTLLGESRVGRAAHYDTRSIRIKDIKVVFLKSSLLHWARALKQQN